MQKHSEGHPDERYMRLAIRTAELGARNGQYAIGAVIVAEGAVIAKAYTTLNRTGDPSAHAEVNAIRKAAKLMLRRHGNRDWSNALEGAWMYSTMEPCAMCASLSFWSGLSGVVYGSTMQEFLKSHNATMENFRYIFMDAEEVMERCDRGPQMVRGFMGEECSRLLKLGRNAD